MIDDETHPIDPALAHQIEDAVMFGRPGELEAVIENADEDALPADLRNGLESLSYFRAHYGGQPGLNDTDRKKIVLMDQSWAMEVLNKIRARIESAVKRA